MKLSHILAAGMRRAGNDWNLRQVYWKAEAHFATRRNLNGAFVQGYCQLFDNDFRVGRESAAYKSKAQFKALPTRN